MPIFSAVGGRISQALGRGEGTANLIGGVLAAATMFAVNKFFAPKPPEQLRPDTRRRGPPLTIDEARWVLGRARTGGSLKDYYEVAERDGGPLNTLWLVLAISEGSCEAIEKIWVEGVEVSFTRSGNHLDCGMAVDPDPNDDEAPKDYTGRLDVYEYFAANGNQGTELRNAVEEWTTDDRMEGLSWVAVRLNQTNYGDDSSKRFYTSGGIPNIEFLVKGIKITYPGQTAPIWTDNAAALRYWFETVRRGHPASIIDATSFQAAFNRCAEEITFTLPAELADFNGVGPRYSANDIITSGMGTEDLQSEFDWAWQGNVAESSGFLHFNAGADRTVRYNITEEDTVRIAETQTGPTATDRVNSVTMSINQSRDHDYTAYDVPEVIDTDALSRDEDQESPKNLGHRLFIDSPVWATWLSYIALREARDSLLLPITVRPGTASAPFGFMELRPGEWVTVTNAELNMNQFLFQVQSKTINEDYTVSLLLTEQKRGNFAETLELPPLRGRFGQLLEAPVPDVRGLASDEIAVTERDGTIIVQLVVTWTGAPVPRTEVEIRPVTTTNSQLQVSVSERVVFTPVDIGVTYEIRARHYNRQDVAGDWSDWIQNTIDGDLTPPADPTGVAFTAVPEGWRVNWTASADKDYKTSQIYFSSDVNAAFAAATFLDENDGGSFTQLGFNQVTAVKVWVRHVDTSGNLSQPVAVTGSTGKVSSMNLNLDENSFDVDDDGNLGLLPDLLNVIRGLFSQPVETPDLTITDITEINENQIAVLEAMVEGGTYDTIEYSWEIVSGGGTLEPVSEE